jgi:hypothetical protein
MTQALNLANFANNINSSGVAQVSGGGTGTTTSSGSGSVVLNNNPTITNPTLSGSTSGGVALNVPAVAGTNTATFPSATGTVMVSGNMPAFSVYNSNTQNISTSTFTKIQFNTKLFDTANAYDSTTNYRFTPGVAGYYQVNAQVRTQVAANTGATSPEILLSLYKNGSEFARGSDNISIAVGSASGSLMPSINYLIYLGATDYIEIYLYQTYQTTASTSSGQTTVWFNGSMVRSA